VGVTPAKDVYDVLEEVLLALKRAFPAGTTAYELNLYALKGADGKLIKRDPKDVTKVTEQLLEATKPLADQLHITEADVAGGFFVVKVVAPPLQSANEGKPLSRSSRYMPPYLLLASYFYLLRRGATRATAAYCALNPAACSTARAG
jgi:hypothetical protein